MATFLENALLFPDQGCVSDRHADCNEMTLHRRLRWGISPRIRCYMAPEMDEAVRLGIERE